MLVPALLLAALDLAVKADLPTSRWLLHERSAGWVVLSIILVVGCVLLAAVPSRPVALGAALTAAGALGNLASFAWYGGAVPNPLVAGRWPNGIAYNLADVFVVLGLLVLIPALAAASIANRDRLLPPRRWERALARRLGR